LRAPVRVACEWEVHVGVGALVGVLQVKTLDAGTGSGPLRMIQQHVLELLLANPDNIGIVPAHLGLDANLAFAGRGLGIHHCASTRAHKFQITLADLSQPLLSEALVIREFEVGVLLANKAGLKLLALLGIGLVVPTINNL
jgi:hypothetical protein